MSAQGGDEEFWLHAQFDLAVRLLQDGSGQQNKGEGARLLHLAAEAGYVPAQLRLAQLHELEQDPQSRAEAARLYRLATEQGGDPPSAALVNLGVLYDLGDGVTQDKQEAARLYRAALSCSGGVAEFNLANMLDFGDGVEADPLEAARLYRSAAEQGHAQG